MIALAGVRRRFHLAQQRVHLVGLEPPSRPHRAVARHGGGDVHQPALERQRLVPFGHVLGEIAHQRLRIRFAEHRGRFRNRDRAGAEGLEHEAEAGKLSRARGEPFNVGLIELDDLGDEQDLSSDAVTLEGGLHALVDDTLVRGVLIDDHDAVARLRHDVSLMQLRARSAERSVDEIGRGFCGDPCVRGGRAGIERGLCGFGKAGERSRALRRKRRRGTPVPAAPGAKIRPERRNGRLAAGRRAALCVTRQRLLERAHDQARTKPQSRKRTSVLAGCTFTSTSRGSTVMNSATTGWRSRGR